ncbi:maleylpyruvate isomerase family mycothiol-dependent enzyme [Paractinoplanes hotanensis]|uniref:Maleylpyruvate isomerase family mycothiol-dependent enzyme n=1 Tax=Paractinoplanes hotanensis TaxID=2906497 RepID=A0ABT0XZN2_9ACTN|nr:maleylpyruvate isomerase family mycothiol-dependent enzyme [Actinoplanes hotanensis]MCM4078662.1 maleylpyruvate isomerase family mycothiol-dependent enzyme [Actinoplanes hotanensis]
MRDLWAAIHAERAALADDLAGLSEQQWRQQSLCGEWTVDEVVAHLTAGASIGSLRWIRSIVGARFDADRHNRRRLEEHRGATPPETLDRFRQVVTSTTAASKHLPAWLGEVVVHGEDIRKPLGLPPSARIESVTEVARFFVARDFTVNSRKAARGLRLEATDGPFASGSGPLVTGTTLAITMALAGRRAYHPELTGPGVEILQARAV